MSRWLCRWASLPVLCVVSLACSGGTPPLRETGAVDAALERGGSVERGASDRAVEGAGPRDVAADATMAPACQPGTGPVLKVGAGGAHATIAAALAAAGPGSTILVEDGVYSESLTIAVGGSSEASRLQLCAVHRRKAELRFKGRVLTVTKPWVTVQGFVLDGQLGSADLVRADEGADHLILRDLEIRNGMADGIDIGGGSAGGCEDLLIDACHIHDLLAGSSTAPVDAHCIVATDFARLTIRDTEAHHCSGDALQVGTDREPWDGLVVERCKFWSGPLPADLAGWKKGESPGENAIDTKANIQSGVWKGTLSIVESTFFGFGPKGAAIGNRAALNLKNQVTGTVDRCTLHDNEIGLRIRGGVAPMGGVDGLRATNLVLHRNQYHVRLEDDAKNVVFLHNTFGTLIDAAEVPIPSSSPLYQANAYKGGGGGDEGPGWTSDNNLFLGAAKPQRATGAGDRATDAAATFSNLASGDYHLAVQMNAPAAVGVTVDRDGKSRSTTAPDVGAYELP